jgi:DNA-binding GntR family transcriptional regulator
MTHISVRTSEGQGPLLADSAYEAIRDRLISLAIPPGAPINEEQLMRELGVGRTPVREAIKRLALESLIDIFPRRGTFASDINITDLADISDVRMQLEGHAAYRAAQRLTDADRPELRQLAHAFARKGPADHDRLMELDASVHRFVYRTARNPYLEATLARYLNLSLRVWHLALDRLPRLFSSVHEHAELLGAIDAGDAERARDVAARHVATFEEQIRRVL